MLCISGLSCGIVPSCQLAGYWMLKPTSSFVYVFQVGSIPEEGARVALSVVPGAEVAAGGTDCVFTATELQDANTIAKMMKINCFFIRTPSQLFWCQFPDYNLSAFSSFPICL